MFLAHIVEYGALFVEIFRHVEPVMISARVEAGADQSENQLELIQTAGESYQT